MKYNIHKEDAQSYTFPEITRFPEINKWHPNTNDTLLLTWHARNVALTRSGHSIIMWPTFNHLFRAWATLVLPGVGGGRLSRMLGGGEGPEVFHWLWEETGGILRYWCWRHTDPQPFFLFVNNRFGLTVRNNISSPSFGQCCAEVLRRRQDSILFETCRVWQLSLPSCP